MVASERSLARGRWFLQRRSDDDRSSGGRRIDLDHSTWEAATRIPWTNGGRHAHSIIKTRQRRDGDQANNTTEFVGEGSGQVVTTDAQSTHQGSTRTISNSSV